MGRTLALGAILVALWFLLSGIFEPLFYGYAAFSVVLTVYIANRMDVVDHEGLPFHLTPRALTYLPWLVWEIAKSNIAVAKVILSPALPISPTVVRFRGSQTTDLGRFIFANSITLTPGTITIGLEGEDFEVHALVSAMVDGMEQGPMNRKVTALEGAA